MSRWVLALAAMLPLGAAGCVDQAAGGGAGSREQIRAVGSSTVYPFTTIVAEQYLANNPQARPPVIESTGTGAGMKLFCAGIGAAHPDIEDASRRMKRGEYDTCVRNGVDGVQPRHLHGECGPEQLQQLCRRNVSIGERCHGMHQLPC